jgi:16S rRNA processing protein RimM
MDEFIVLGKIVDAYGLNGAVKLHLFADDPERIAKMRHWWIGAESSPSENWICCKVSKCRVQSGLLLALIEGLSDRTAAEAACGKLVGAPRSELPATDPGEYYWADLIGLEVINTQGVVLGRVLGLIETPANDVLRVGVADEREQLLPFVGAVVLDVDLPAGRMRVDWEQDW